MACLSCTAATDLPGRPLSPAELKSVTAAIALLRTQGLSEQAGAASRLLSKGQWRGATADDPYLAASEKGGDTPFAYTMPDDRHPHQPLAIVLAPRFFTSADTVAEASIMTHEMAHWRAYEMRGKSDEYDGYKAQFDTHKQLGLTDKDGLTYFMMVDGVVEYVVPRDKRYLDDPEVKDYMSH